MSMPTCKFTFDDGIVYEGFAHGSTWNGFDNVAVTRETLDKIIAACRDDESREQFRDIEPMLENGLYSLGYVARKVYEGNSQQSTIPRSQKIRASLRHRWSSRSVALQQARTRHRRHCAAAQRQTTDAIRNRLQSGTGAGDSRRRPYGLSLVSDHPTPCCRGVYR